jgi:predicted nucleic acid-binding protein
VNLLIDTDVLVYFLRGDKRVRPIFMLQDRFYSSYITKKELLKKPGLSQKEREKILNLLGRIRQVPVDGAVASLAESLLKRYHSKGLQVADALIAATALKIDAVLVTYNQKHYRFIEGLRLFPIEKK